MKTEIVLSGVGGQGLISTGEIVGKAAAIYENFNATMTASYGSETRGTFTKTDIIISDGQIGYPNVERPDVILCLAQVAYDRYIDKFKDGTKVFYDTDMVVKAPGAKGEHVSFPFRTMSIELGSIQVANTIALGAILKQTGILKKESVMAAISARFHGKDKVIALNDRALDMGLSL
jgi:2-oxoglutarate ferredoxin oxidoreductase subunit gamma